MKTWIKIVLLLLAIFPMWLTIMAIAEEKPEAQGWKEMINTRLLEMATEDQRIQVLEIAQSSKELEAIAPTSNFELDLSEIQNRGFSMISLRFKDEAGRLAQYARISAKLLIQKKVAVAARDLTRGNIIDAASIRENWISSAQLNDKSFKASELLGKRLSRNLKEGQIVFTGSLEVRRMVNNGDRVKISVLGNGIAISSYGIAKEAGSRGQTIRILNPESKKEIYATITDERNVEVRL